jgi:3-phenylpropionate/cinnamic acid dioxygenase small subunit
MDGNAKLQVQPHEIERFFFFEARLLDAGRFHEWLDLFTDDSRYMMPIRHTMQNRREGTYGIDELAVMHFNDSKAGLEMRIKRLDTGLAHAETPPSRTRHFISNVEVEPAESPNDVMAHSNFLLFQGRHSGSEYLFSGRRQDWLRKLDGQWKIAQRLIVLDHTVLPRGLSVLF